MPKPNARSQSLTSQDGYSAVIIADLVAEVQVPQDNEPASVKQTKEETNLAYDGHMDGESSPAVVSVDASEVADLRSSKSNGAGISRGVILNAVQFGQSESTTKCDDKSIQLTNALSSQVLTQPVSEPLGFKDMSILRKMAFGFSFLPSIMFVLCFAIILPCKVPKPSCVEEVWHQILEKTEITSHLEIPQNVVLTLSEEGENYFMTLDAKTGKKIMKEKIPTIANYLSCGNIINTNEKHCIVMEETGKIYAFNSSEALILWNRTVSEAERPSLPVILPDCNNDKLEEIAVAVSGRTIQVLNKGYIVSSFDFIPKSHPGCDSVPRRLIPWTKNGLTDIIFTCQRAGKDTLIKVPQNTWCWFDKESPGNTLILPKINFSKGYILHPTEDGLVLWSDDEVSMLQRHDGSVQWTMSNHSHSNKNRFVLYGNFVGKNKQVALFSSDLSTKLEVTILNSTDGSIMKSSIFPFSEATEVTQIHGKERDFALIVLKKVKKDIIAEAFTKINDISTTIVNYISNEDLTNAYTNYTNVEEITFLDLDGSLHSIREIKSTCEQGVVCKSSITAVHSTDGSFNIYLLRTPENNSTKIAEIRNIGVINWDISVSKSPQCALE